MKLFIPLWKNNLLQRLAYPIVVFSVTAYVVFIFILNPGINAYFAAKVVDMINGVAHRPFVYRLLLPGLVRLMTAVLPEGFKATLNQSISSAIVGAFGWEQAHLTDYVLLVMLM